MRGLWSVRVVALRTEGHKLRHLRGQAVNRSNWGRGGLGARKAQAPPKTSSRSSLKLVISEQGCGPKRCQILFFTTN